MKKQDKTQVVVQQKEITNILFWFSCLFSKPYSEKHGLTNMFVGSFFYTSVVTASTQSIVSSAFYVTIYVWLHSADGKAVLIWELGKKNRW